MLRRYPLVRLVGLLVGVLGLLPAALAQNRPSCVDTAGLRVWLPLTETSGTHAQDLSGTGHHGTLTGGQWQSPTPGRGPALYLTGPDQLVVPLACHPTAFTVAFWIRPSRLSNWGTYIGVYEGGPWGRFGFHSCTTGNVAAGIDYRNGNRITTGTGVLVPNEWQHFVFTYANQTGTLYRNGVWVATEHNMPTPLPWQRLHVGAQALDQQLPFDGHIADLRVYLRALAGAEAQALAGCADTCGPPAFHLSPSLALPAGQPTTLQATATPLSQGLTYTWSPAAGLNTTRGARVVAAPAVTTTYTVTAHTGGGCPAATATATVTVTVTPPPPLLNPPVDGCAPTLVNAAPPTRTGPDSVNFVRTWVPRVALTDTAAVRQGSKEQVQVTTEYLDGLGRPVQTVRRQESPQGHDLVQPVAYDALGRQPRQYLPYVAGTTGAYRPNARREQYDFYRQDAPPAGPGNLFQDVAPTGVAYAEQAFEASPLSRVLAQGAPGEAWQLTPTGGHAGRRSERPNTAADAVPRFVPGYAPTPHTLTTPGPYPPGELWLTETRDEHGSRQQSFADKQGQVVATRVEHTAPGAAMPDWLSTYYVYDDFHRRRAVVPPKAAPLLVAAGTVTPAVDSLLFRYRYDGRGRPIAQQVPGQVGDTYVVYDVLDRPILTQDPTQRARAEWAFVKYDALGRPVLTGLVRHPGASHAALQYDAEHFGTPAWEVRTATPLGYTTDRAYPRLGAQGFLAGEVLTVTHYDDYNFDNDAAGTADAAYDPQFNAASVADLRVVGLPTRTRVRVLGVAEGQAGAWLRTTTFYDAQARPIQVQATNALAGEDVVTSQLSFTGQVLHTVARHTRPNRAPLSVRDSMSYDHAGRLRTTHQQVSGEAQPVLLATHTYNELGQLTRKTLGSGALAQPVDYRYNPRGWLTRLNDADNPTPGDLFHLTLSYDCGFTQPQYNGNLAGQKWRGRDGIERAYGYTYDGANRLRQGDYVARAGGPGATTGAWTAEAQRFGLRNLTYDANGNILSLARRGLLALATRTTPASFGPVDQLTYAYAGNRLQAVTDQVSTNELPRPTGYHGAPTSLAGDFQEQGIRQAQEYAYDVSGDLTADQNKGITAIAYNHLHLPRRIHFGAGADSLVFRYSATGQKVAKLVYQPGQPLPVRTDYVGGFQYERDSLRFFPHAEGRVLRHVSATSGAVTYQREFTVKDHLGNLRLAYRAGRRLVYTATLEPGDAPRETHHFDSLSVSPPIAAPVGSALARTGTHVARLHAGGPAPHPLGPLKQLAVQKGDTVLVRAPGYYPASTASSGFTFSLAAYVAGLLQQQPAGPPRDGRTRALPLLNIGVSATLPALTQHGGGVPQGYVRLLVFDTDSTLLSSHTRQLSLDASSGYEELYLEVIAPTDGYMTAYVGNESDADVYFDDVRLEHRQGLQVQETHYDPVGLELAGLAPHTPGLRPLNQYKFNGKEFQADLGLNWNHQDWRFFDPQLGRWHTVDPLSDAGQEMWSPYSFGFNNALRFGDPDGRCPNCPPGVLPAPGMAVALWEEGVKLAEALPAPALPVAGAVLGAAAVGYGLLSVIEAGGGGGRPAYLSGQAGGPGPGYHWAPTTSAKDANGRVNASAPKSNEGKKLPRQDSHEKDFDRAREKAFDKAGMTDPKDVKFTKQDPKTGTIVEFKGPNGGKVVYDSPHPEPGPGHDKPHAGFQQGRGTQQVKGNITYDGTQHPYRSIKKGEGDVNHH